MQKTTEQTSKKAKVTEEHKAEAALLRAIWKNTKHVSQTEFGETYGIGNQSAVGQFLRGDAALSLKAARGFALGLGCPISAFSKRLAAEAEEVSKAVGPASTPGQPWDWPFKSVTPRQYRELLTDENRATIEALVNQFAKVRNEPVKQGAPEENSNARAA